VRSRNRRWPPMPQGSCNVEVLPAEEAVLRRIRPWRRRDTSRGALRASVSRASGMRDAVPACRVFVVASAYWLPQQTPPPFIGKYTRFKRPVVVVLGPVSRPISSLVSAAGCRVYRNAASCEVGGVDSRSTRPLTPARECCSNLSGRRLRSLGGVFACPPAAAPRLIT